MPSKVVQFISVDEAVEIHQQLIHHFGGPPGIRDMGLLESALYRPQTGYYQDLVEMAAALFESLIMNHPFVDGNKRAAFFVTDIFLRLNGRKLNVVAKPAHEFLKQGRCDYDHLVDWIRRYVAALS